MLVTIKHNLRSRKIVLSLMCLLFFGVVLSYLIPQRFSTPENVYTKWEEAHQNWLSLIAFFDLDHLFTAPWFAVILFAFLVSLALVTVDQFRIAASKTFGIGAVNSKNLFLNEEGGGEYSFESTVSML